MTKDDAVAGDPLARAAGCFSEAEMAALLKVRIPTLRNWRSRRSGPPYATLGNQTLYPIERAREYIARLSTQKRVKRRKPA